MNKVVQVRLWGTVIGYLGYSPGQTEAATFEYNKEFIESGIQVSPLLMSYPPVLYTFSDISRRTFRGLPGIFADSLPDTFGNQLIDIYMARNKISSDNITALDRLLYIGERGMGALTYHPAERLSEINAGTALDVKMLAELAQIVTSKNIKKKQELLSVENLDAAIKLIKVGSSAGGARSKAVIAKTPDGMIVDGTSDLGSDHTYWIIKFDSNSNSDRDRSDPKGMTKVEYLYSLIAKKCGIDIPQIDYIADGDDFHFLIKRFDRVPGDVRTERLHYASFAGLVHADRDTTGAYSYEQIVLAARRLGLGQNAVTELFRRSVLNVVGRNQDDHTKNFGFLMDKSGKWKLSPAFDMTYAFDPTGQWTRTHQIRLNLKQDKFTKNDLIEFGKYCNLSKKKSEKIIDLTIENFREFSKFAREYDVDPDLRKTIEENLRLSIEHG